MPGSPYDPFCQQITVINDEITKVGDSEPVTPVMIGRVPVASLNHQDEPCQAISWYSPPNHNISSHKDEVSCLLGQHSKVRKHGEHSCG